jgi:hypothetical protein
MFGEQSGEMPRAYTHPSGEHFDGRTLAVKCAVIGYQTCRAFHGGAAAAPCWTEGSGFGTTAKTGAKSRRFGGGSAREETNIARVCGSNRADRPAIDAGRSDTGKEAPVMGWVAGHPRSLAFRIVEHVNLRWLRRACGRTESDPGEYAGDEVRIRRARRQTTRYLRRQVVPNARVDNGRCAGAGRGGRNSRRICESHRPTIVRLGGKPRGADDFRCDLERNRRYWSLSTSDLGWIGGIYFAGYALAVPFLAGASDRMDARWLYIASALLAAAASFAFSWFADGFVAALVLRFLGGIGLAGVHMPGLNLLMDRIDRAFQGRAAGIYTSSYAAGSAGSFLIAGIVDAALGWRATFIAAGIGPLLSICALGLLPAGSTRRKFDKRPPPLLSLLRNRALIAYVRLSPGTPGRFSRCGSGSLPTSPGC